MGLLKHQEELLFALKIATKRNGTNEVIYKSECLGYLPYGQYHWIEVDGEEIKTNNLDSLLEDLSFFCKLQLLTKVREVQGNDEDIHIL